MKIRGHSGSQLILTGDTIIKYSQNTERLYQQYLKQASFYHDTIKKPTCQWMEDSIHMDYIHGYNLVEFSNIASDTEYEYIIRTIADFIKKNEREEISIDLDLFERKFDEIYQKTLLDPAIIRMWYQFREKCKDIKVNGGYAHGDYSLSNMIIGQDRKTIYLIDFLNTFFDCPMMDWAKLKQSTYYGWELLLYDQFFDRTKTAARLSWFDREINKYLDIKSPIYLLFQYFNLLRILPYTTDKIIREKVVEWIINLV